MRLTRKTIVVSVIVSLAVLLLNYIVGNTSIPLPNEMSILQGWDKFVSVNGTIKDSIPDEIMLIDVAYDKELVDYEEDGFYVGKDFITDRNKLFQFLSLVKEAGNYKYVMLDVIFEEGYKWLVSLGAIFVDKKVKPRHILIYTVFASIGFAWFENIVFTSFH